jgi:hypothetical protein
VRPQLAGVAGVVDLFVDPPWFGRDLAGWSPTGREMLDEGLGLALVR